LPGEFTIAAKKGRPENRKAARTGGFFIDPGNGIVLIGGQTT
jgi:hypothetical protein